jgi:hypothetical protein
MTIAETAWAVVGGILTIGLWGGMLYMTLLKPELSNYPTAVRGVGICMLSGTVKVLLLFAENLSPIFGADWINYVLIGVFVVGMLMMMSGFSDEN